MKSGCRRAKNDRLEKASEKTDPKRLTLPLDAIKYITINYSTNTLKYIPHTRRTNVQKSQKAKQKTLITGCLVFYTLYAQSNVPDWSEKLQAVIQNQEEPDIELVQLDANMREEWMILSDLRTSFDNSSDETSSSSNYWHRDRATYSEQQIDEMPTWVKTKKEQVTDVSHPNNDFFDTLSEMQKLSYKYCQQTPSRHFRRKGPIVSHN